MSGHLRQAIGPTRQCLQHLIDDATSPQFTEFEAITDALSKADNIQHMRRQLFDIKTITECMVAAIHILEAKNQAWGEYIQTLSAAYKIAEEEIYSTFTSGPDGFVTVSLAGTDQVIQLEMQRDELEYTLHNYELDSQTNGHDTRSEDGTNVSD